jgi:hypothetical protein
LGRDTGYWFLDTGYLWGITPFLASIQDRASSIT